MAQQIWWHGCVRDIGDEGFGGGKPPFKKNVCRKPDAERNSEGCSWKKVARPSQRKCLARSVVADRRISIRMACAIFEISETCYRYEGMRNAENERIAKWLIRLTYCHKKWEFGLCFLYLRNMKGFGWNHKRVYHIYCKLELNLRIKPCRRLVRAKAEALAVPDKPNVIWSMDFMADQLSGGRSFRTFNVQL